MSGEIALPAGLGASAINWRLQRNVAEFVNPLGQTKQFVERSGYVWKTTLKFAIWQDYAADLLAAFLEQATAASAWMWVSPQQQRYNGALSSPELLSNGTFLTDTTGWTAGGSALSMNARRMKILNSGAASGSATQNVTVTTGSPYILLADRRRGKVANWRAQLKSGATNDVNQTYTTEGRSTELWTPTAGSNSVVLLTDTAVANDTAYWENVSLARCLTVNGAAQTGNRLNVSGGPISTNGALLAGSFVCFSVGTIFQMVRLIEDLDTDGSGNGQMAFSPALRSSPANGTAIVIRNPFVRCKLSQTSSAHDVAAPNFQSFAVELTEDPTP
jgi:hypothetical protein